MAVWPYCDNEKDLATQLIKRKIGEFVPEDFPDRYTDALKDPVEARIENREPVMPTEKPAAKVVNLMSALRASLKTIEAAPATADVDATPKPKPAANTATCRKAG